MAKRRVEIGPTGETVRFNVARIRKRQGLTLQEVSDRLRMTDHPLAHNAISEIERGARRVDVDDLVALAVALNCSPLALLLPPSSPEHVVSITGADMMPGRDVWDWAQGKRPLLVGVVLEASFPDLARPTRIRAAKDQYKLNSDAQLQENADAPNIYTVAEGPSDGDD